MINNTLINAIYDITIETSSESNTGSNNIGDINLDEITHHCIDIVFKLLQSNGTAISDSCANYLQQYNRTYLRQLVEIYSNITIKTNNNDSKAIDNNNNNNNSNSSNKVRLPYENSWYVILIWSVIFGSMVFAAIVGNLLIIWIISTNKLMRTIINLFLMNLTISDLLTVTFNATFNFVFMLTGNWPFGEVYCVANNFITNLTIASAVFTIIATSVDRYIAIVHPLKPRMTKRRAIISIVIIWISASFFASPTLLYSQNIVIPYTKDIKRTICLLKWPDGYPGESSLDFIYNIAFLVLTYILPMVTMAIAYYLMARVLWWSERIGESSQTQLELIRSKQKVVCMLICVISVFGICWLPYQLYFLCIYIWPQLIRGQQIQHIYLAIYWLAMANSLFNPIILFAMNNRFRHYIMYYVRCQCFFDNHAANDTRTSVVLDNISGKRVSSVNRNNHNNNRNIYHHYKCKDGVPL